MKAISFSLGIILLILIGSYFIFYYVSMRDVKTPEYSVIKKQGNIEIRNYQPMLIAEVVVTGKRKAAIQQGFRLLAGYIFGKNHTASSASKKISMTAPVMQQTDNKIAMTAPVKQTVIGKQEWKVQFVMPKQYTLATIPKPDNKAIKLIEVPAHKVVVIRFSGRMSKANLNKHRLLLNKYVQENRLNVEPQPQYAFYNPPWTLPFMRRNEIMYGIRADVD